MERWLCRNDVKLYRNRLSPPAQSSISLKRPFHDAGNTLVLTGTCHLYALLAFGFGDFLFEFCFLDASKRFWLWCRQRHFYGGRQLTHCKLDLARPRNRLEIIPLVDPSCARCRRI